MIFSQTLRNKDTGGVVGIHVPAPHAIPPTRATQSYENAAAHMPGSAQRCPLEAQRPGLLLGTGDLGTLCLAGTQIPNSRKESRCWAETTSSTQTTWAQRAPVVSELLMLRAESAANLRGLSYPREAGVRPALSASAAHRGRRARGA